MLFSLGFLALPNIAAQLSTSPLEQAFALDEGKDGNRDATGAAALYMKAAEAGDAFAHLRLGYLFETGDGVSQDYAAAKAHYQAAVDAGLPAARVRLAICHLEGWGGPVDRESFVRELRLAGEAGETSAQHILARIYLIGFVVPEDRSEGLRWLELAAKQDDAFAQYVLGREIETEQHRTLRRNMDASRTWYRLSAEQEYRISMRAMARTFLNPSRSAQDRKLGRQWLELATETGDEEAPYILAVDELTNTAASIRDETKAREWMELAAKRGNDRAKEILSLVSSGRNLSDSIHYVLNVALEDRYTDLAWRETPKNDGLTPPRVLRAVRPMYPQSMDFSRTNGTVTIEFVIDTRGKAIEAKVVEGGHPRLNEAALATIALWEFRPGEREGQPVAVKARIPMVFNLDEELMDGVDGLLAFAKLRARDLGTVPADDFRELRLASFKYDPADPVLAPGKPFPSGSRVVLIVCLNEEGNPLRAYPLFAEPDIVGSVFVDWVLKQEFLPREIDGKAVPANVVVVHKTE